MAAPFLYPQQPQPAPSGTIQTEPVTVVGPQYSLPYPVDLACTRKSLSLTDGCFVITDVNDTVIFKVKEKLISLHDKRTLLDASGNPVVTVAEKVISLHGRHYVYRGGSTNDNDLLFTVKRSSMIQFKACLDVFLAANTKQSVPDFKVKGSWSERSCIIYAGDSNNILAQMHKKTTIQSVIMGKDKFMLTVYPNIDYAFAVALIVVLDDINGEGDKD
ncbi:hypothetical protein ACFE04_000082 [Oxalis oulophora]